MRYYVYILSCSDGSLYTGYTTDIEKRLDQHNGVTNGGAKYTKMHRPVTVVHTERFDSKSEAMQREHVIKSMNHAEKLELVKRTPKSA